MRRLGTVLLGIIFCFWGETYAQGMDCFACGRQLSGQYLQSAEGRTFCSRECFESTLPKCVACDRVLQGRYITYEDKRYCSQSCLATVLPRCESCGGAIGEHFLKDSQGRTFCSQECFESTLPKCAVCGLALRKKFITSNGEKYCSQECFETTLPKCSNCDATIRGEHRVLVVGAETLLYCMDCAKLPTCFACAKPGYLTWLSDGRGVCADCSRNAVTASKEAEDLFRKMRTLISLMYGSPSPCNVEFHLTNRTEMAKLLNKKENSEHRELGLYRLEQMRNGLTKCIEEKCSIYVLDHLPREYFCEVVAHELAHDWQHHVAPGLEDPLWREGFAEYSASLMNSLNHCEWLNQRMENNTDPIYGGGYRKVRDFAKAHGWKAMIEELKCK